MNKTIPVDAGVWGQGWHQWGSPKPQATHSCDQMGMRDREAEDTPRREVIIQVPQ